MQEPAHPRLILAAVCLIALMSTAGIAMPYPILAPLFVAGAADGFNHFLGLPPKLLLGIALAANPLGILLGNSVIGALSDRYGRRRVLLTTLLLTFLGYGVAALALEARLYPLFVLARFLTGVTEGNAAVARAVAADLHPTLDRVRSFALLNAMFYGGWLVGPMLGGFTLHWGVAVPFWLAGLVMLPCALVLWVFLQETVELRPHSAPLWRTVRDGHAFRLLGADPRLARLFWMQFAFTFGVNAFYDFYPLWLVEFAGQDSMGIAWVTAAMCSVMTLFSVFAARFRPDDVLAGAMHHARWVAAGLLTLTLLTGWAGVTVIVLLGLPLALYNALMPAWCSERFARYGQGSVMGLLSTAFCLASVVVSLTGGLLAVLDTRLVMLVGGMVCLGATLALGRLRQLEAA